MPQKRRTRGSSLSSRTPHITLVFDKGNNSEEAFESLQNTPFHFVGSLVPSQHSELLTISRKQFRTLTRPGLEGVEAYRAQKKVFGQPRTIVVTFNQNLYDGQLQGLPTSSRPPPGFHRHMPHPHDRIAATPLLPPRSPAIRPCKPLGHTRHYRQSIQSERLAPKLADIL
jgi:hypothetical protein